MNARRLLKLAEFLETKVPRERFDFSKWVGDDWNGAQDMSCGTTACALGWATQIPAFRRLGLHIVKFIDPVFGGTVHGVRLAKTHKARITAYAHGPSMRAASVLFSLRRIEVSHLFVPVAPYSYDSNGQLHMTATPKQVARHIRAFVKNGGIPK